ncbi:aquaporin [endosymbiont 'TC1' of Trimyema compressum]|uniref:aquaporin n=1 Tax=endosymbiont 'TC1' of Trimyema compressum TaxID=243899 RepID=UPI000B218E24|nr:aquaporin [endosymbiont 'TC1' of Trimyema compressum]
MWGALIIEIILTFVFVIVVLGVTSTDKMATVSGIVIGLTLAFVHILGIPLTDTSVNPARSIAPAIFVGGEVLSQLWLFIVGR